jgi:GT2 family glycosyltransferase
MGAAQESAPVNRPAASTDATPQVAIVVVNYNSAHYVGSLIDSLLGLSYKKWRLYVVDNASTDGSAEYIEERIPAARIIKNPANAGFAPGVNRGLGVCLGDNPDYVLLLNPDTTFEAEMLDHLIAAADAQTMLVPKVLSTADGTLAGHAGRFDWRRGLQLDTHDGEADDPALSLPRDLDTGSFSCMLIPATAFRIAGPLDERLAFYYEDTDFVERAQRAGYRLRYQPAAVLYHREGAASGGRASAFSTYYTTRNRAYVVHKHGGVLDRVFFSLYYPSTRILRCIELLRARQWRLVVAILRGMRDYYTGRMGMTYTPQQLVKQR